MKKFKGTKGDWYYDEDVIKCRQNLYTHYICDFSECDQEGDELNANAQLIATAPKMLEVLEKTLKAFDEWENLEFNDALYLEIKETINKATKI